MSDETTRAVEELKIQFVRAMTDHHDWKYFAGFLAGVLLEALACAFGG